MTRAASIFVTIVLGTALVGCSGLPRLHQEVALKALIHRAYKCESGVPLIGQYARHFERGWKQAYYNISKGADACPPSTPPEEYWSVKYQTPDGCRKIAAWYDGYHRGTIAAERDLRPQFATVPLSPLCFRPGSTACQEVPELRSEATAEQPLSGTADPQAAVPQAADPGEAVPGEAIEPVAGQLETTPLPAGSRSNETVHLSSYLVPEADGRSLISGPLESQLQRLPQVEFTADATN